VKKIVEWLSGKKTLIVSVSIAVVAVIRAFGYEIPVWIWPILAALGLAAIRAGVKKTEA
jgi:hypothetical protein